MYLSHPVRRMRDDPLPDESVTLVVELADESAREPFLDAVAAYDGTVDRDLQFADLAVRVPESAVADLCEIEGIERIETGNTLDIT